MSQIIVDGRHPKSSNGTVGKPEIGWLHREAADVSTKLITKEAIRDKGQGVTEQVATNA